MATDEEIIESIFRGLIAPYGLEVEDLKQCVEDLGFGPILEKLDNLSDITSDTNINIIEGMMTNLLIQQPELIDETISLCDPEILKDVSEYQCKVCAVAALHSVLIVCFKFTTGGG